MIKRVLNEWKTGFCQVGCGLGLPAPSAPRPSTFGLPALSAAAENEENTGFCEVFCGAGL